VMESHYVQKFFRIYVFIQILAVLIIIVCLTRYFFIWGNGFTSECLFMTTKAVLLLTITLVSLRKGRYADPGFIHPAERSEESTEMVRDLTHATCKRCQAVRPDDFTHHCSVCDKCIDGMDHHCYFMDNCVGKGSLRYFFQFCLWMCITLLWGIIEVVRCFYTINVETGAGVQCLTDLRPDKFFVNTIKMQSSGIGGSLSIVYKAITDGKNSAYSPEFFYEFTDTGLLIVMVLFLLFCGSVFCRVLLNVRYCTDEPGRRKAAKQKQDGVASEPTQVRSLAEMKLHIFGQKDASSIYMLFPFD
jgi:hypothetical protein